MAPNDSVEEKTASYDEAHAGLKFKAGHSVIVIISDRTAPAKPKKPAQGPGGDTPDTPANPDAPPGGGDTPGEPGTQPNKPPSSGPVKPGDPDPKKDPEKPADPKKDPAKPADPKKDPDKPAVHRCRLTGMHFETDKTFLLPSAIEGMQKLCKLYGEFKNLKVLINGHADRQGSTDPEHNRVLSEQRALSIKAFLLEDAKVWTGFYGGAAGSRKWGVREDQYMLAKLGFYSGKVDGDAGPVTKAAVKAFQKSKNVGQTGTADAKTREELIKAYMALDGTSILNAPIAVHGCGHWHPLVAGKPDQPENRRVEVFLFDGDVAPPPKAKCADPGCAEYAAWLKQATEEVDLDQGGGAVPAEADGTLEIEAPFAKDSPAAKKAKFTLTADDGSFTQERAVKDATGGSDGIVIAFTGLTHGKKYSLTLDDGDGKPYFVFRGHAYGED